MTAKKLFIKESALGIIFIVLTGTFIPGFSGTSLKIQQFTSLTQESNIPINDTVIHCVVFGKTKEKKQTITCTQTDASMIFEMLQKLKLEMVQHPFSDNTQRLKEEFIILLAEKKILPINIPIDEYSSLLNPPWFEKFHKNYDNLFYTTRSKLTATGKAVAFLCSIGGEGKGFLFPFIMLPRPRFITFWKALDGTTVSGKLLTIGGFRASGAQTGVAFGFWGIGLAFAYPTGNLYGFLGYSLFAAAAATNIERYPPDYPPEILEVSPEDNARNVPLSQQELSFSIKDPSGDLMSYSVTTTPDIGSGSGSYKIAGTYTVPIQGLQELTTYSWTLIVRDDIQTTAQTFTFTTQAESPSVFDPIPKNGEHNVLTDIQKLQFTINDFQGDVMYYTVETSPNIGSGSGVDVHNGIYSIPVSGLLNDTSYRWYVNVTDGTHWTRKAFGFQTGFPTDFDPFEKGWHYRKKITIHYWNIPEDLTNFPVLVSITDNDLKEKAQFDGEDILFMNNSGFSTRLNYEMEYYYGLFGELIAWVNITHVSSDEDTTFYMYYGNMNTISQQDPEKTWDSHYMAVWHFSEESGKNVTDSTANHFDATANYYTPVTTGKIGKGRYFDKTNSEILVGTYPEFGGVPSYTVEAWASPKSTSGEHRIFDRGVSGNPNTILLYQNNDQLCQLTNNGDLTTYQNAFSGNTWTHAVGVFTGSGGESVLYKNGEKGIPITSIQTGPTAGSFTIYLGRACLSSSSSYRWYGTLDEIRFSNIARSSAWISASYKNQNNPTSFLLIGPEE